MDEKLPDSTQPGMTRGSSYPASIYGKGSLELVCENGQIHVQEGSSSGVTRMAPSCDGYPIKAMDESAFIANSARLSALYSLMNFPLQMDSGPNNFQRNSHQSNDQNSCQLDLEFSKSKSSNMHKDGCANLRPVKESKLTGEPYQQASYLHTSSTQQCQRLPSSQTPPISSQKQDMGQFNHTNILRPSLFLKSNFHGNSTTLPTNNSAAAATSSSKAPDHSVVINSSKGSQGLAQVEKQKPLTSDASNPVSFAPRSEETPPDVQSEAVGNNSALSIHGSHGGQHHNQASNSAGPRAKGKADTNYCDEALLESSSMCSLGASNNRNLCTRKHDDTEDSTYLSDNDEEPEDVVKEKPVREGARVKRRRNAETHNLCERKRRDKINKRMRILKELIPNCNKVDKASMLDDAIEYLKTLKLQLQVMSMGAGFCMPFMMLPTATHHMMNTPHLHQLLGIGTGFRPGTTIPCTLPQFPITPLTGITDNRVRMFGFPNQIPPMPISHLPFIPMFGNPSTQPLQATTNLTENPASSQLNTLKASVPDNSYLSGQATKQAPNQETN